MEAMTLQIFVTGIINLLTFPLLAWFAKRAIGKRLDAFDEKRDLARERQAEDERLAREQRDAERTIILAMSRTMLLDIYEKCMAKGCYTLEEREVYSKLFKAYKSDGGNSVIDDLAPRIRRLPTTPPSKEERRD